MLVAVTKPKLCHFAAEWGVHLGLSYHSGASNQLRIVSLKRYDRHHGERWLQQHFSIHNNASKVNDSGAKQPRTDHHLLSIYLTDAIYRPGVCRPFLVNNGQVAYQHPADAVPVLLVAPSKRRRCFYRRLEGGEVLFFAPNTLSFGALSLRGYRYLLVLCLVHRVLEG